MKFYKIFSAFMLILVLSQCTKSKTEATPTITPAIDTTFNVAKATILKQGSFSGNMNYTVSGSTKLYEYLGKKYIYFENFGSNNGPDLKVYLATTNTATQFISLGALKATTGTQLYLITTPPDFTQYNKILIWCQQFSVLFGKADLQ
jgi:Electron transfer DM13